MPNSDWWHTPIRSPYLYLIIGAISLTAAVVWTRIGRVWVRFHGWVYRDQEPKRFWREVGMEYLMGVVLIGIFLYLVM